MRHFFSLFLSLSFIGSAEVHAGACCGGGLANFALMTGDEQMRTLVSVNTRQALFDISQSGILSNRKDSGIEETQNQFTLEHSQLIRDELQWGVRLDGSQQSLHLASEQAKPQVGLGDVRLSLGYEFLSEFEYSWWKPKGFLTWGAALPLGKSIHETWDPAQATSEGHFTPTLGVVFLKIAEEFDASWASELQVPLERTFINQTDPEWTLATTVSSGWIAQTTVAIGHTFRVLPVRLAGRISPLWRSARTVTQDGIVTETQPKRLTSLSIDLNWFLSEHQQVNFTFTDQTALRSANWATNTVLSQLWSIAWVHRLNR